MHNTIIMAISNKRAVSYSFFEAPFRASVSKKGSELFTTDLRDTALQIIRKALEKFNARHLWVFDNLSSASLFRSKAETQIYPEVHATLITAIHDEAHPHTPDALAQAVIALLQSVPSNLIDLNYFDEAAVMRLRDWGICEAISQEFGATHPATQHYGS